MVKLKKPNQGWVMTTQSTLHNCHQRRYSWAHSESVLYWNGSNWYPPPAPYPPPRPKPNSLQILSSCFPEDHFIRAQATPSKYNHPLFYGIDSLLCSNNLSMGSDGKDYKVVEARRWCETNLILSLQVICKFPSEGVDSEWPNNKKTSLRAMYVP